MDKTFKLHLHSPEHDLLNRHGRKALLAGIGIEDLNSIKDMVSDMVKPDSDFRFNAASLYYIGVMQGIHNERARCKHE